MSRACDGIRVLRDNIVVYEGKLSTLKRFKDDVKEVQTGYECGILIENYNDLKVGDILENYIIEKIAAKL
jgi:translation initiation factor IF-2